jgi:hypothetical protein
MSEHKRKLPGHINGQEYRKAQRAPLRVRWVKLERVKPTDHKWARRHGLELTETKKNTILKGEVK